MSIHETETRERRRFTKLHCILCTVSLYSRVCSGIIEFLTTLHWRADPSLPRALTIYFRERNTAGATSERNDTAITYGAVLRGNYEVSRQKL